MQYTYSSSKSPLITIVLLAASVLLFAACGDDNDDDYDHGTSTGTTGTSTGTTGTSTGTTGTSTGTTGTSTGPIETPEVYMFPSRADANASSVSYSGQTARHVLIADLKSYIGGMTDQIDAANFQPDEEGEVVAALDFYFRFDGDSNGEEPFNLSTTPETLQKTWNEISTNKNLVGKLAGNDSSTDYVDWSTDFKGWSDAEIAQYGGSIESPEGLVIAFFETLEKQALDRNNDGVVLTGPNNEQLPVYVTLSGLDLNQLVNKFLLGAIAFHQGCDDYLDDDVDGKGLLASNALEDGTYTPLEHAWDEGFGYFGAARDYANYTDEEIAAKGGRDGWSSGYYDTNQDGAIDLTSEMNFGASSNAAKRDLGSQDSAKTDFTQDIIDAFLEGRTLITNASDTLTDAELTELKGYRDTVCSGWEKAIAATAVHYINDTLEEMDKAGTDDYSHATHAKVWSELKGFALSLQFNPRSPTRGEAFDTIHNLIGDAPVLPDAGEDAVNAYRTDLLAARDAFVQAYGFNPDNAAGW